MTDNVWTFADAAAGLCTVADTGKPRPVEAEQEQLQEQLQEQQVAAVQPAPDDAAIVLPDLSDASNQRIAEESARVLRLSAMRVFARLGADDWLFSLARTHPKDFLKTLQRLMPQAIEATVEIRGNQIPEAISSLTIDDLIAMRRGSAVPVSENVIDAEFSEVKGQ